MADFCNFVPVWAGSLCSSSSRHRPLPRWVIVYSGVKLLQISHFSRWQIFKTGFFCQLGRNFALCSHWIDFCIYILKSGEYHDGICLKVSKSQKHFFLKLHSPINEGNIKQSLPYEARAEFCLVFCSFFGQWRLKKNCFWDLLTFIRMFLFTIYCKKHLHLLQYYKNC